MGQPHTPPMLTPPQDERNGILNCLPRLAGDKDRVREFYDTTGWQIDETGGFTDATLFVDPGSEEYLGRCRARVREHLPESGQYLLDVASGPVHFPEYRAYSDGFEHRVCVDLSVVALRAARHNVGDSGVYVLGDVTALPFKDGSIDAIVSLHTLYHVPEQEQAAGFREIHRVLKPGGTAVVVYYWQTTPWRELSLPARLAVLPMRAARRLLRRVASSSADAPDLYYFAHTRGWFTGQRWPFEADIRCWSSLSPGLVEKLPRPVTRLLFRLESRFPHLMGRFGYPMIVIRK
jgi:SAM-dependent methyltransferase